MVDNPALTMRPLRRLHYLTYNVTPICEKHKIYRVGDTLSYQFKSRNMSKISLQDLDEALEALLNLYLQLGKSEQYALFLVVELTKEDCYALAKMTMSLAWLVCLGKPMG